MLNRKLLRELKRDFRLLSAVVLVVALGVMLFVASAAGYLDLSVSYARLQEDLKLADLHIQATVSEEDAQKLAAVSGVAQLERRTVFPLPMQVPNAPKQEARIITLPDAAEPTLDRLYLEEGQFPKAGEVLLETHLARFHKLSPGDKVIFLPGEAGEKTFRVSGIAVSAEYLWVARDSLDLMPAPGEFGVVWMRREEARAMAGALQLARPLMMLAMAGVSFEEMAAMAMMAPEVKVAASRNMESELLVQVAPEQSIEVIKQEILKKLPQARILSRKELVGVRLLQMDVDGLKGMALFFPVFFLGVAAFVFSSVLARVVDSQAPLIGTLRAIGVPKKKVIQHYILYALIIGGIGSLLGTGGGVLGGWALTAVYASELHIPQVSIAFRPELYGAGLGLGLLTSVLAAIGPTRKAASILPAEALRTTVPPLGSFQKRLRSLQYLPLSIRQAVRAIARKPFRSLTSVFGVAAALTLVVTSVALAESIEKAIAIQSEEMWRYDLKAELLVPKEAKSLQEAALKIPGVQKAEVLLALPVTLSKNGQIKQAVVLGLGEKPALLRSVDFDGTEKLAHKGSVIVPRTLANLFSLEPEDKLQLKLPGERTASLKIEGISDAAMGGTLVAHGQELGELAGVPGQASVLLVAVEPGSSATVREALFKLKGVVRVQDLSSLRSLIEDLMALTWVLVGAMLGASVLLAGAVLYGTASLSILERRRELATARALGQPMRVIVWNITLEHGALALVGLALGLPLSALALDYALSLYESEFFSLPFMMSARTLGISGLGVALVLLVAQGPALWQLAKENLAEAVRSREG
jgi:putative ABC transport system permease protein